MNNLNNPFNKGVSDLINDFTQDEFVLMLNWMALNEQKVTRFNVQKFRKDYLEIKKTIERFQNFSSEINDDTSSPNKIG